MDLTLMIYTAGAFIAAAVAYRLLHIRRRRHEAVVDDWLSADTPSLRGIEYDFTCVLGVNGSPSKCTVKRVTPE